VLEAVPNRSAGLPAGAWDPGANYRIEADGGNQAGPFGAVRPDGPPVEDEGRNVRGLMTEGSVEGRVEVGTESDQAPSWTTAPE